LASWALPPQRSLRKRSILTWHGPVRAVQVLMQLQLQASQQFHWGQLESLLEQVCSVVLLLQMPLAEIQDCDKNQPVPTKPHLTIHHQALVEF